MSAMQPPPKSRIPAPITLAPRVHPSWQAGPRKPGAIDAPGLRKLWEAIDGDAS